MILIVILYEVLLIYRELFGGGCLDIEVVLFSVINWVLVKFSGFFFGIRCYLRVVLKFY